MDKTKNIPLIVLCYAGLYLIWGSTYFFIGKAVETISPGMLMAGRFILSGIVFILFPLLTGQVKKLPTMKQLGSSLFLGFFLLCVVVVIFRFVVLDLPRRHNGTKSFS